MTVLGKILVILNLVFTLVVGGLIVVVYTARTNWQAAYKRMEENYKAARATADVYVDKARETEEKAQTYQAEATHRTDEEIQLRKNHEKETEALAIQVRNVNEALAEKTRELLVMRDDVGRAQKERQVFEIAVKDLQEKNKQLLTDFTKVNQEMIAYKLDAESLRGRLQAVAAQYKDALEQLKQRGGSTAVSTSKVPLNPAPRNVEGLITQVDGDLMALSIGSDSGLEEGNTLDAYRLIGDRAQYLGVVRVVSVKAKQAVAQPLNSKVQLKAGDHVGVIGPR